MNTDKVKQVNKALKSFVEENSSLNLNEVRVIVALERAIARLLISSELAEHLVFKGGFVLLKRYESLRYTRDADVLAVSISKTELVTMLKNALLADLDDGFWYGDIQEQELNDQGEYGAYRFNFAFQIGTPELKKVHKLSRLHIDVGFSDRLPRIPSNEVMASILTYEEPVSWKIYPIQYIVAEKIQTLYERGSANSRAKDVFDLIYLIPRCEDLEALGSAINQTFENRNTELPKSLVTRANEFDRTILANGWPGVKATDKPAFEVAWDNLMVLLDKVESYL